MLYRDARPLIASGDLLAFSNGGFVSRLIRTWEGGSYSHVGIAWVFRERVFVLAAREGRGVGIDALSTQVPAYWLSTGAAWTPEVERLALEHLGLPYSYPDCLRVALGRPVIHDGEVCSVYAAIVLRAAGLDLPQPSYTPATLVEAMLTHGADLHRLLPDAVPLAAAPA